MRLFFSIDSLGLDNTEGDRSRMILYNNLIQKFSEMTIIYISEYSSYRKEMRLKKVITIE